MTMSVDGFVAGPNAGINNPMGDGGDSLYDWVFARRSEKDTEILNNVFDHSGAVIIGSRMYHNAIENSWGGASPFAVPALVVTRQFPKQPARGFCFVMEGIKSALIRAKAIAGKKDIWVIGGANLIQQFISQELFDEIWLHVAPVILNNGIKLFENMDDSKIDLSVCEVIPTPAATHVRYRRRSILFGESPLISRKGLEEMAD